MVTGIKPLYVVKEYDELKSKEVHVPTSDGKSKKVRYLQRYEVKFPRGHSIILTEDAMQQQGFLKVAPQYHEASGELDPNFVPNPETFIGLTGDEFIVSNVEVPVFK